MNTSKGYYAAASEPSSVWVPAILSAFFCAIAFVAIAGLTDTIRFFPGEAAQESLEAETAAAEPAVAARTSRTRATGWTKEQKQQKADLERRLFNLMNEIDDFRSKTGITLDE